MVCPGTPCTDAQCHAGSADASGRGAAAASPAAGAASRSPQNPPIGQRFCALSAIVRAAHELGVPAENGPHRARMADQPPDPGLERRPGAPARRSHRRVQRRHLPPSKEAPLNPHEGGRATPGWSGRSIPVPGITPLGSR